MKKLLSAKWSSYKYRFLPWVALSLGSQHLKPHQQTFHIFPDQEYLDQLRDLLVRLSRPRYQLLFRDSAERAEHFRHLHLTNRDVILDTWGFILEVRDSSLISGAGRGVFVAQGRIPEGQLVGLYPGCVYQPSQPILLQSLGNPYILRY